MIGYSDSLSDELVLIRAKMNWTQKQLADYLGVGISTVWRWETEGKMPHAKTVIQIKEKLKNLKN